MGVPKFFRYISERYPCLSQLVLECEIPEFDNLYLDMNGIIHNCSHPNDFDPHFRITEEKIFKDIFHYIEILFRIIKPQKLFFMAVDGVAPRAKMNQQRGRRFRSAKEAEDQEKALLRKGELLPSTQRFDSNCITPGTLFMAKLQAQLKYFVASKISSDKDWQKVTVILSGHECPGEGEHKIMDYIRYLRSQSNYDTNTRHCLYGLDADLIMLGLCTHEPHFALLREEVKFGRKQQSKKINSPEDTRFYLLHLSLLREYLEMEFNCLKVTLNFKFVLENIIDDWVLMGFLVGNDFIPHLPGLHISNGVLPVLYKAYCEVLPTLDGYLNEGGKLNLARFEAYMKKLAAFDIKQFREIYDDFKYIKQKSSKNAFKIVSEENIGFKKKFKPFFETETDEADFELTSENDENFDRAVLDMMDLEVNEDSDYYDEDCKDEDRLAFFKEFCLHKQNYYQDKLDYVKITPEEMRGQAEGYVKALQWNLHYYYDGIRSWSWYYPHHYAPYISDIQNFKNMKIEFELGKPFLPFEQLLAVLPSLSKNLLPEPFQELMTSKSSPIIDYYPCNFDTDLNGKKNDWEAVVLIPFIDEQRLLTAMESCYHRLTDEEKQRNKHGPMHVYTYTEENLGRYEAPAYFNSIEKNHAIDIPLRREEIFVSSEKLRKGLLEGVLLDVYFPGFPTFKHLQFTSALESKGVRVFQSSSQGLNMIVRLIPQQNNPIWENLLTSFANKNVFVAWPYLSEAKVVGICSRKKKCKIEADVCQTIDVGEEHMKSFTSDLNAVKQTFLKSKGIDVGSVEYLVQVRTYEGKKFVYAPGKKIGLEKKWSNKIYSYPLQTIVNNIPVQSKVIDDITLDEIYSPGSNCFLLNRSYYGCLGIVYDKSDNDRVRIKVNVPPEPSREDLSVARTKITYYTNNEAAHRSCIPNYLLARITGTILVVDVDDVLQIDRCVKVNIGLNLKFSRRNQLLPGYTKRTDQNQWLYSDRTIALIREYAEAFPDVMRYLAENSDKDHIFKNDLFPLPGQSHMLNVISNWLDSKLELKGERRSCDASLLEADVIANLETKIEHFYRKNKRGVYLNMKAKPFHLYTPSSQVEKQSPDYAEFRLLDRVVNVRDNFLVPLGYRGIIIGIEKQQQPDDTFVTLCDILFDQSFHSASQYFTKKKRVYRLPDKCLLNITFADEQKQKKENKKPPPKLTTHLSKNTRQEMIPIRSRATNSGHAYKQPTMEFRNSALTNQLPYVASTSSNVVTYVGNSFPMPSIPATRNVIPQQMTYQAAQNNVHIITKSQPMIGMENLSSSLPSHTMPVQPVSTTTATESIRVNDNREEQEEPTLALKKLLGLRVADENEQCSKLHPQKKETNETPEKCYVVELQELFQKTGKGIPKYDYTHVDGNFKATVHVPGIETGISSDLAPTKKAAGEKAAFDILRFLNLVQNYGDRVSPIAQIDRKVLDVHLNFLRMHQTLQETAARSSTTIENRIVPQRYAYSLPYESEGIQGPMPVRSHLSYAQPHLQNMQVIMNAQTQHQPSQTLTSIHQQFVRPQTLAQFHPSMSSFQQLPPRPMTTATNYPYQQNFSTKYQYSPQQLYYQNVQNVYCNQPNNVRGQYPTVPTIPSQQWFSPIMPQPANVVPNMQHRQLYQTHVPQHLSQDIEKSTLKTQNYPSTSQNTFVSSGIICTKQSSNIDVPQNQQSTINCSGRASKTPKKNRLAANFVTKASI